VGVEVGGMPMVRENVRNRWGRKTKRRTTPRGEGSIMVRRVEQTSHPSLELTTVMTNGGEATSHVAKKDGGQNMT
jgi:hypothetical protein